MDRSPKASYSPSLNARATDGASDVENARLLLDTPKPVEEYSESKAWDYIVTLIFCTCFLCVGPVLILLNKHIMKGINFDFPIFVAAMGQMASTVGSWVVTRKLKIYPLEKQDVVTREFFLKNMVPVAIGSASTLIFGNHVYLHLSVSLIQMLKSFTPVITLIMLAAAGIEWPTHRATACVVMIAFGTCFTTTGEINFSTIGLIQMSLATVTEGLKLVLSQKLLKGLKFHAFEALYYFAPPTAAIMLTCSAIFELPRMLETGKYMLIVEWLPLFMVAALFGFFVNIATFFVIKRTNAVMVKVMSTARNAGLVLIDIAFYGTVITSTQTAGYFCCLIFFGLYNYFKMNKM